MEGQRGERVGEATGRGRILGAARLLLLLAWQGWLTLGLFGDGYPWLHLRDEEPIISGAHPQHLHFGGIGARALRETGRFCAYDPEFQGGYLKTPIFNGSRFAEI